MLETRQDIIRMLETLECRLKDVSSSFKAYEGSLEGLLETLDCIDDKLYELDCYLESQGTSTTQVSQVPSGAKSTLDAAKEDVVDIAKDGAQVFGDLTRSIREIKDAFKAETRES